MMAFVSPRTHLPSQPPPRHHQAETLSLHLGSDRESSRTQSALCRVAPRHHGWMEVTKRGHVTGLGDAGRVRGGYPYW